MSIIREFLNGPRPPGGSSAQLPSHLTPQRTGHKSRTRADSTSATGAQTSHGGDRGWWWVQHERETVRRPTSHERAVQWMAEPPIARVACIFGLTARVRLLAPSAPVSGLAPAQIPDHPKVGWAHCEKINLALARKVQLLLSVFQRVRCERVISGAVHRQCVPPTSR